MIFDLDIGNLFDLLDLIFHKIIVQKPTTTNINYCLIYIYILRKAFNK